MTDLDIAKARASNDEPSCAVVTEIRRRLSKPILELQTRGEEIEGLLQTIDALESECDTLEGTIADYKIIRSSIRHLPSDILHEIFYRCLPTHRNPVMSEHEAPMLLTLVCRSWRSVAFSSPRLWTRVHIPMHLPSKRQGDNVNGGWTSPYYDSEDDQEGTREDAEKNIRFRQKLLQTWLSRSGALPLSVSLSYFGSISQSEYSDGTTLKHFFNTLFSFSSVIIDLELKMPARAYSILFGDMPPSTFPSLRRIRLDFGGRPGSRTRISLINAPKLESLSIAFKGGSQISSFLETSLTLCNLTTLAVHYRITMEVAVMILKRQQQLKSCKMSILNYNEDAVYAFDEGVISLPRLAILVLSVATTTAGMEEVCKRIDAPCLSHFGFHQFTWHYRYSPPALEQSSPPPFGVHHLLERCNMLTKLSLDASCTTSGDILSCLASAPHIIHLVIGQPYKRSPTALDYFWTAKHQRNFDLNDLVIKQFPTSESIQSYSTDGEEFCRSDIVLLPRLEIFEGGMMSKKTTGEVVKKFVLGRVGASAIQNGVSSLRYVNMAIDSISQTPSTNPAKDIQDAANADGAEITINLDFNDPGPYFWPTAADPPDYFW
ncbi:hypothetical protein CVT26_015338 [Gymnopilus dilepis]|uniref:F-box domain-containing protein n=1 Tax=Gymnopilus dilepis TaxID=231916 RepID=A0A409W486_9AGAR|nr:hypothetical protein CVT26_015338 [Gymnopilus dilepis]